MKIQNCIKKFPGKHKILTTLVVLVFLVTAITNKYGPYTGRVVDAETGAPIEGAVIYMVFYTRSPNPGGSTGHYAGAVETLTDVNGEFNVSYRAVVFHPFCLWDSLPIQLVFKPGYGVYPWHKKSHIVSDNKRSRIPEKKYVTIGLPKLSAREERLSNLWFVSLRSSTVPYKDRKFITSLVNEENSYLGYAPEGVK